jgi:hypothetical protein
MGNKNSADLLFVMLYFIVHQRGQQAINTTRKSSYKCEDSKKILKTSRNDETPVKLQRSSSTSDAGKKVICLGGRSIFNHHIIRITRECSNSEIQTDSTLTLLTNMFELEFLFLIVSIYLSVIVTFYLTQIQKQ